MNQSKQTNVDASDPSIQGTGSVALVSSMIGWSMDVTPGSAIPAVAAGTSSEDAAAENSRSATSAPRGLNRLAPKTDGQSAQRRARLQKLRGRTQDEPKTPAETSTAAQTELPAKWKSAKASSHSLNLPTAKALKEQSRVESSTTKISSTKARKSKGTKPAVVQQKLETEVVRSAVFAEIASLVSKELRQNSKANKLVFPSVVAKSTNSKSSGSKSSKSRSFSSKSAAPDQLFASAPIGPAKKTESSKSVPRPDVQRKAQSSGNSKSVLTFALKEPTPPKEERYVDWLRRVVLKHKWMSVLTTCYVHWLILLALAALLVHGPEDTVNLLLNATFAAEDLPEEATFEVAVPEPAPMETSVEDVAEPVEEPPTISESEVELDESVLGELTPASAAPSAEPTPAKPSKAESKLPGKAIDRSPPQAVSKGSFSVWTEPSSPQAGEPYRIIIQICLPDGMQKYNVADLEGVVVGSDGYRKPIPGYLRGFLPVEDGYARLIVPIVTADEKVQDTIFIRSRILKETQKLLLEFESGK